MIEAGAGHLDELQSLRGRAHLAGEREGDQHVDVGQLRDDPGLVGQDDVARHPQASSYRRFESRGEGAGEGNLTSTRLGRRSITRKVMRMTRGLEVVYHPLN
jgi:hypothetical protein